MGWCGFGTECAPNGMVMRIRYGMRTEYAPDQ